MPVMTEIVDERGKKKMVIKHHLPRALQFADLDDLTEADREWLKRARNRQVNVLAVKTPEVEKAT